MFQSPQAIRSPMRSAQGLPWEIRHIRLRSGEQPNGKEEKRKRPADRLNPAAVLEENAEQAEERKKGLQEKDMNLLTAVPAGEGMEAEADE